LYLGLRKKEWLFLTCHNYWIVCRLVSDDHNPFLAYSPAISIEESSEPFRAFLGAILSVAKGVRVEPSAYNPNITLDNIEEEQDDGPLPEDDIDDGSEYRGSSGSAADTTPPKTRSRHRNSRGNTESELLVHTFLGRYRSLGSPTLRLLHILPNRLKTSKYGHVCIPCRITLSPFHGAGTVNYAYGLPGS
jgi:hypothetical protein